MRYVLLKCNVGDLFCQRMVLEEFASGYIKVNTDGNLLAKIYVDFINAVDFLQSLDKEMLRDADYGREYLQDYNLNYLENRLCVYPEDRTEDDMASQASSYNMFGGFRAAQDNMSIASMRSRADSGNNILTKNSLKIRSLHERHSVRVPHNPHSSIPQPSYNARSSLLLQTEVMNRKKTYTLRQEDSGNKTHTNTLIEDSM